MKFNSAIYIVCTFSAKSAKYSMFKVVTGLNGLIHMLEDDINVKEKIVLLFKNPEPVTCR
jgi:hypothetical protein